jgi:hypothetical protein
MTSINAIVSTANNSKKSLVKIKDRLINKFKSNPTPTAGLVARLKSELDDFVSLRNTHDDACTQLLARADEITDASKRAALEEQAINDTDAVRATYTELLEKFENIRVKYEGITHNLGPAQRSVTPSAECEVAPKLKDIEVPEFDGNVREFLNFKELFESLVHKSPRYLNVEKMYFLRQALKGDAAVLLVDLNITNDAYPEAWAKVCQWHENKQLVINTLFHDLFAVKRIKDRTGIRKLVLEVDSIVRGLKAAGENPQNWGSLLNYFVSSKLDDKTLEDWQNSNTDANIYPQYELLQKFLLGRVHNLESVSKPKSTSSPLLKKSFAATSNASNRTCCCCKQATHLLIECDEFKMKTPVERYEIVKSSHLCANCFRSNHTAKSCSQPPYKKCPGKHHTLLHFDKRDESKAVAKNNSNSPVSQDDNTVSKSCAVASAKSFPKFVVLAYPLP